MSNTVKKFYDNVVGNSNKILDIVPIITSSGDIKYLDELDAIINSWKNILSTPIGSYDHDPLYGSNLYQLIFEPADELTMSRIKEEVEEKLMLFDDRAQITGVNVSFFGADKKGFTVTISVRYKGEDRSVDVNIAEKGMV